jgi:hypothetical protein
LNRSCRCNHSLFFISYRRQDTAPIALLLKYEIEKRLQFVRVSVDVEDIRVGEQFPNRILRLIDDAHATIVLIGQNWMPRRDAPPAAEHVRPAMAEEDDWVVTELRYSATRPISYPEENRYGLANRAILPVFVCVIARGRLIGAHRRAPMT